MFRTLKKVSITIIVLTFFCGNLVLAEAPIYITQVQITGGKGKTELDFIELFNPNSEKVNLKGYRLVKRTETGSGDILIKVWSKDALIPAKSFYLWANKSYSSIRADSNSSATISEDNGVGLRSGANDTGLLVDSVSWGKANNGFKNVININPDALKSIQRSNRYSPSSDFVISASNPHNSTVNDLSAEFLTSQKKEEVTKPKSAQVSPKVKAEIQILGTTTIGTTTTETKLDIEGEVVEEEKVEIEMLPTTKKETRYLNKYLFITFGATVLLIYILINYVFRKKE